jgi:hypothetical protein
MRITDFPELIAPTGNDLLVTVDIANDLTKKVKLDNLPISLPALTALATKQDSLVSGTNIKTINSTSVLGSGNIAVQETLVSGTNIKTLNNTSLLGSGNIVLTANPSGVAGAIQFSNGSAFASDASNLFWDDTNNRLGVGTNAPGETLDVNGQIRTRATTGVNIMGAGSVGLNDAHIFLNQSQGAEISYGGNGYSAVGGYNIIGGNTTIGATVFRNGDTNLGARLGIRGSGSTSATTSLLVQNSAGTQLFKIADDGAITIGTSGSTIFTVNSLYGFINMSGGYLGYGFSTSEAWTYRNGSNVSQFKIGTTGNAIFNGTLSLGNGSDPVASAQVEITSTTKGFLPPRMTTTQKNAIASPATGLVVMDITTFKLCVYNGTSWVDLH